MRFIPKEVPFTGPDTHQTLWRPIQIGSLVVAGRLYKTATHETLASEQGHVTDGVIDFYRPMAESGLPLIITGNVFVSWQGKSGGKQLGLDSDDKIEGMRRLADMCHAHGTKLFAQLNHGGSQMRESAAGIDDLPVTATARIHPVLLGRSRAMKLDEFPGLINSFADAAERAQKAGCDGVQIQMGHGYLVSQFLTPGTNRRKDRFGGNAKKRMALAIEVYRAVRQRVGPGFPIIAKINGADDRPFGVKIDDQINLAKQLEREGLDGIEVTRGHFSTIPSTLSGQWRGFIERQLTHGMAAGFPLWQRLYMRAINGPFVFLMNRFFPHRQGFNLNEACQFTKALSIPVISCGGFNSPESMAEAVKAGQIDAVSVGRGLIANPYLYRHVHEPIPNAPVCDYCNKCIGSAGGNLGVDCFNAEVKKKQQKMLRAVKASADRLLVRSE